MAFQSSGGSSSCDVGFVHIPEEGKAVVLETADCPQGSRQQGGAKEEKKSSRFIFLNSPVSRRKSPPMAAIMPAWKLLVRNAREKHKPHT